MSDRRFWDDMLRAHQMALSAVQKRRKGEIDDEIFWLAISRARRLEVAAIERYQFDLNTEDTAA